MRIKPRQQYNIFSGRAQSLLVQPISEVQLNISGQKALRRQVGARMREGVYSTATNTIEEVSAPFTARSNLNMSPW